MDGPITYTTSGVGFVETSTVWNLGPLTTTFTPPSGCLRGWHEIESGLGIGEEVGLQCFPPNLFVTAGYYSPGLCPASYVADKTMSSRWTSPGETGYHCCPSYVYVLLFEI